MSLAGLFSCKRNIVQPGQDAVPVVHDVYVGVFFVADNNGNFASLYWKNGIADTIPAEGQLYNIAVADSVVYTAGTDRYVDPYSGNPVLNQYWKNNIIITIPEGNASLLSVAASGSDVCAAGYYPSNSAGSSYNISYWKNGSEVNLVHAIGSRVSITPVAYFNGDIYIAGTQLPDPLSISGSDSLFYWKNGERVFVAGSLPGDAPLGASVSTISVSGTDVYLFGQEGSHSCYWKNGKQNLLPDSVSYGISPAYSNSQHVFAVSGSDVYLAGSVNGNAVYLKNGHINYLANGKYAYGIAVSGTNTYVCGIDNSGNAALWKNGKEQILGIGYPVEIVLQ
jgi:hypothetical protein